MQRIIRPENERVKSKMTNKPLLLITLAIGFLATSAPLIAHHGATNVYDFSKPVVLKGTITLEPPLESGPMSSILAQV